MDSLEGPTVAKVLSSSIISIYVDGYLAAS